MRRRTSRGASSFIVDIVIILINFSPLSAFFSMEMVHSRIELLQRAMGKVTRGRHL